METIEILQQEKTGIFETAKLKTIIPKTPEEKERVEKIKDQIIDIEKYRGLIHFTQLPNFSKLLSQGIKRGEENKLTNTKWGFGGRRGGEGTHLSVDCTRISTNSSFHKWINIPFTNAGPLLLLFDTNQLSEIEDYDAHNKKRRNLTDYLRAIESKELKIFTLPDYFGKDKHLISIAPEEINIFDIEGIDKKSIIGIIINPCEKSPLEIIHQKKIFISAKQIAESTTIQLTRLFYKKPDAHLVPLYDHLGNVLWPEKIPYDEVQRILSQRKN